MLTKGGRLMKRRKNLFLLCFFGGVLFMLMTSKDTGAIPAFARKYEAPCTLCHSTWPRLNDFGFKYLLNGYQMPDSEDGAEEGKIKVAEDLTLDSPASFPPISIRLEGSSYLSRTTNTYITPSTGAGSGENGQSGGLFSGGEMAGNILGGGTLAKNVSYWFDIPQGSSPDNATKRITQAMFLGFHNIGGAGIVNIKFGSLLNSDLDAVHKTRHVISGKDATPMPMGWRGNSTGRAGSNDLGVSIYGRPNLGHIIYDFIISQGNNGETDDDNDGNLAYAGMLRGDIKSVSASVRYFANSQGFGGKAGKQTYSNDVNEWVFGVRYASTLFDIDFLYDIANQSDVSSTGIGTKRESGGFMLEGLFRISKSFELGALYETLSEKDGGSESYNDGAFSIEGAWYITQNARMTLKYLIDKQDERYRAQYTDSTGVSKGIDAGKVIIGFDVVL